MLLRLFRCALLLATLPCAEPAVAGDDPAGLGFTAQERQQILTLGPWPPKNAPDPSNRVSGNADAIALGARLFFDARLSPTGRVACVTCHQPDRAWTDGRPRGHGLAEVSRNTPTLANLRLARWFGWGGGTDSLWMASLRPLLDPREFDSSATAVAAIYAHDADLACRYERAFDEAPIGIADAQERVMVNTAKALAAFQETLTSGRTPFDEFRDALARGDSDGAVRYPQLARQGLKLFIGRGNCIACHNGPNFSNGEFADVGVPFFIAAGEVDSGRYDDLQRLRASPYNLLGRYSDDAGRASAQATRHAVLEPRHWGEYRVPSLRNVAVTAPYMHSGQLPTLHDVVRHYSTLDESRIHSSAQPLLRALRLTPEESDALVAFLETLTDPKGAARPRLAPDAHCEPAAPVAAR